MVVIGMGLVFAGYWVGLYGYTLIRGYDVSFIQMARPQWPGATAAAKTPAPAKTTGPGPRPA
jgi:hypothetical protein